MRDELLKGYYLIMYIKPFEDSDWFHEVLFYGYNDSEKKFKAIVFKDRAFRRMDYSYKYIQSILQEIQDRLRKNKKKGMELSLQYQYPIYAFRLREDYPTDSWVFRAYRKINDELEGVRFHDGEINSTWVFKVCSCVYRGISCLTALENMIKEVLAGEEMEPGCQGMTEQLYCVG